MPLRMRLFFSLLSLIISLSGNELPNTKPLLMEGDLSAQMVAGISRFLDREIIASSKRRPQLWSRDYKSDEAYRKSIQKNREHLRFCIGAVDELVPFKGLEFISNTTHGSLRYKDKYMERS